jgi:hypothetical protein
MRLKIPILTTGILLAVSMAHGQPPQQQPSSPGAFVERMMAFDKNHDGKLTRDEITDDRLLDIFDRADANHDGVVTKEELEALYSKEVVQNQGRGPGGAGGRGPGGPGRGGFGPQPGQIMPGFLQDRLNLTDDQKSKIEALQKEVDAKLDAILTAEQKQQLKQGGGPRQP